jgi:hypothetical protein
MRKDAPAITGEADPEYQGRIDAERGTFALRAPLQAKAPQRADHELPLFADTDPQGGLF